MAGKVLTARILQCGRLAQQTAVATRSMASRYEEIEKLKIGSREWVGYGMNGHPNYIDRAEFPMPAIRFKEPTPEIQALREKEKGDWKKLSIEEKKALYRASFCQTFAEMKAPTGEWKSIFGWSFFAASFGVWIYMLLKLYVYPPLPASFDLEHQQAQLERMIKLDMNPISGPARQYREV